MSNVSDILLYLKIMLGQLKENKIKVILIPAPDPQFSGHMIRASIESNPEWYSELCNNNPRKRKRGEIKNYSYIKRDRIIKLLQKLINGNISRCKYTNDLIEIAKKMKIENEEKRREYEEENIIEEEFNDLF